MTTTTKKKRRLHLTRHQRNKMQNMLMRDDIDQAHPTRIDPKHDYFSWANHYWIRNIKKTYSPKQKYIGTPDNFKLIQHRVNYDMLNIIDEHTAINEGMKQLHHSLKHLDAGALREHIKQVVEFHETMIKENNLWEMIGAINRNEMVSWACPISWDVSTDEHNNQKMSAHLNPPVLSLFDFRVYMSDDQLDVIHSGEESSSAAIISYKHRILRFYKQYIHDIFVACLGENYEEKHNISAENVYAVESDILNCMTFSNSDYDEDTIIFRTDAPHAHGKHQMRGATRVHKHMSSEVIGIDWPELAKHIGYHADNIPPFYVANSVGYLEKMVDILKRDWSSNKWKSYWLYIHLRQMIWFHPQLQNIYTNFNEIQLQGKPTTSPKEFYPLVGISYAYSATLSKIYTNKYKNQEYLAELHRVSEEVRNAFIARINRNAWVSKQCKINAISKLRHMHISIGESTYKTPDPSLKYDSHDAWGNLLKISAWRVNWKANTLNKPDYIMNRGFDDTSRVNWSTMRIDGSQSYIVNAFYVGCQNLICIPTAYMQLPNIDTEARGYEYTLAHAGFTFGHEMAHGLHINGTVFDDHGRMNKWLHGRDLRHYNALVREIKIQYENVAKTYGLEMDATLSMSENLADITGLAVAEDTLVAYQEKSNMTDEMKRVSLEYFYSYYAIQNRSVMTKKDMIIQEASNPHLYSKIRTNVPLSRLKRFKKFYKLKKKDGMFSQHTSAIW